LIDERGTRRDTFSFVYGFLCGAFFLLCASSSEIEMIYESGFLVIPVILLLALVILGWLVTALAFHMIGRRWRRVLSVLAGPPVAFLLIVAWSHTGYDLTWLRFEAKKAGYVADLPQARSFEPRMQWWHWGDNGFVITATKSYSIVFDESDEIALPPKQRSNGWRVRADHADIAELIEEEHLGAIRKLDGHFYLVERWFP
jgi:Kef-type K+ transport system membrane component KefB